MIKSSKKPPGGGLDPKGGVPVVLENPVPRTEFIVLFIWVEPGTVEAPTAIAPEPPAAAKRGRAR